MVPYKSFILIIIIIFIIIIIIAIEYDIQRRVYNFFQDAENSPFTGVHLTTRLEMNDDIFHFEILKISCHFWNISRPI